MTETVGDVSPFNDDDNDQPLTSIAGRPRCPARQLELLPQIVCCRPHLVAEYRHGSHRWHLDSIASFSGDLSSLTAPPFILSPVSLTEFPAYWCERPDLFAAIADAKEGEDRHIAVLRWFIVRLCPMVSFPFILMRFGSAVEHVEGSVHLEKRGDGLGEEVCTAIISR